MTVATDLTRSTGQSPFLLMFGVQMRNAEDALTENFEAERERERNTAREAIYKIQEDNRKAYDKQRKPAKVYSVCDLLTIRKTKFATGAKVQM